MVGQLQLDHPDRMNALRDFFPDAQPEDWTLSVAGQRVQIIKNTASGAVLKLGTEVVSSSDGSLAALLGASPGASTAVSIMLEVLQRCCTEKMATSQWQERLKKIIPSFGFDINAHESLFEKQRKRSDYLLGLR